VKFLEPRQESAGKVGIISIRFYGFVRKTLFMEEEVEVSVCRVSAYFMKCLSWEKSLQQG
jgi:hypothetical protein